MFTPIPAWTYEGKAPSVYTFFEAIALAGLENKTIRLDAATQKALLGSVVFGKRAINVKSEGVVNCYRKVCFGTDWEECDYTAGKITEAIQAKKQLSPGVSGRKYL